MSNFLPSLGAEADLGAEAALTEPNTTRRLKIAAGALASALTLTGCTRAETGLPPTDPKITCLRIVDGANIRSSPSVPGREEAKDHNLVFSVDLSEGNFLTDLKDVTKAGELTVQLPDLHYVQRRKDNNGTWYGIPTMYTEPLQKAAKTTVNPKDTLVLWVNGQKAKNCSKEKK